MSDDIGKLADEVIGRMKTTEELKHVPLEMYARVLDRALKAEAERDALLYNGDSQYCAGMSAGFELGRNDDRAELSRIITQRWSEIADAKARAALAPSPAGREE